MGADCPDTCCSGWKVPVDKRTYQKYQQCQDGIMGPLLQSLVVIKPAGTSDRHYAEIRLSGGSCVFLSKGLCSIQSNLGEGYLSNTCSAYPRIANLVNGRMERSLDLSCPESARLVLLDPKPIQFVEGIDGDSLLDPDRLQPEEQSPEHSHRDMAAVRNLMIRILQNRTYTISQRLVLIGHVCDRLQRMAAGGDLESTPVVVMGFQNAIGLGLFNNHLKQIVRKPATQLGVTLNLLAERMRSDSVSERFRSLFGEFQQGIGWTPEASTPESNMDAIVQRYGHCHAAYYWPLMKHHEYMLEHYLVTYAFRNLFPYGTMEAAERLGQIEKRICAQYSLMVVQFAILKSLLIGVSGVQRSAFSPGHVAHVVQVGTKALDHSLSFPASVMRKLESWALTNPARLSVLVHN